MHTKRWYKALNSKILISSQVLKQADKEIRKLWMYLNSIKAKNKEYR